jgi:hypothetical protein
MAEQKPRAIRLVEDPWTPVKTPVRPRVNVQIVHYRDGSILLRSLTPGTGGDDNSIEFGLLPD